MIAPVPTTVGLRRTLGRYLATDGLLGPDTRLALAALQERIGVRPSGEPDAATVHRIHADLMGTRPAVTVVRTSLDVEERALRGSSTSGVPVDMLYRRRGFDVVLVDGARLQALPHLLAEQPTALVHFTAGLVEAGGAAALDLDSDQAPPGSALEQVAPYRLTATALDRLLQGLVPKPVVVLDVPGPRSPREIATQLLLRNAFAGDLFAMGDARGIVATGLARYAAQQRLYEAMIGALAGGAELGQVVNAIRSLVRDFPGPQDPQHAMAFGATTLFARNAAVRLPWAAR